MSSRSMRIAGGFAAGVLLAAGDSPTDAKLGGSIFPNVDAATWQGWTPSDAFAKQFQNWPDKKVPDDIEVWCKGFIPKNASSEVINGMPVIPILGPGGLPIPGLLGQCAGTDGRDWSDAPPASQRPTDSRFWAYMGVARGRGSGVSTNGICGISHNVCCNPKGCWDGSKYGAITCSEHCPDEDMQVKRVACWTPEGIKKDKAWPEGQKCDGGGSIVAAKAYIQGRGGNPCGTVAGIPAPVASWDVGLAVFPTKRKVTITGFVDDAPSYECYARAKDGNAWGPTVTLAQIPMDLTLNIALELAGYSDRPINPTGLFFDLPLATDESSAVIV